MKMSPSSPYILPSHIWFFPLYILFPLLGTWQMAIYIQCCGLHYQNNQVQHFYSKHQGLMIHSPVRKLWMPNQSPADPCFCFYAFTRLLLDLTSRFSHVGVNQFHHFMPLFAFGASSFTDFCLLGLRLPGCSDSKPSSGRQHGI